MKSDEKETTTDNNFLPSHITIPAVTHTNPYLHLILKEVIYYLEERIGKLESNKCEIITRMFNSVFFRTHDNEYMKKELHRIWLFIGCLTDLIVNKPEIIGYIIGETCKNKVMENKENDKLCSTYIYPLFALEELLKCYVKLFNPQSVQITFLTESCYELSKKSIYDLENVITKFVLDKNEVEKEYTLNNLYPVYIDGIKKFLEGYAYLLEDVLAKTVINYWTHKLPKLINKKTSTLKVTPEIEKFTKEVFQFYKNFYMKINKEFEDFECKNVSEKNNIVPLIYYYFSMKIIKSLSIMINYTYRLLFYDGYDSFTNWDTFAKFFIYPAYEIHDSFCKKLIIDDNDNKFKLYKYFSNCNNKRLLEFIIILGQSNYRSIYSEYEDKYLLGSKEKEDHEWVYVKNKLLENKNIIEKWIDYFKKFQ